MENNSNNFTARPAAREDSRRIWEIRNHPVVREHSGSSDEIPFEQHEPWFKKKYFSGANNHCFVLAGALDSVIGYCRLDFDSEHSHYRISIALNPDFHGKGLGHYLLSQALRQSHGRGDVFAEIKKDNVPSLKLFKKNNFTVSGEDKKNYYLKFNKNTMHNGEKIIFVIVTRGFIIRNILRSGTLELLKKAGYRVVIFFDTWQVPDHLYKEFTDTNVSVHGLRAEISRLHRQFAKIRDYLLATKSTEIVVDLKRGKEAWGQFREGFLPKKSRIVARFQKLLIALLSRTPLLKRFLRFLELYAFTEKNQTIRGYFDRYQPNLVFGTSIVSALDIAFMKEARRRGITTVAMPKTWDTIPNGYFRFISDYFIVHNELARQLAVQYQNIKLANISVVGMAQFDWYRRTDIFRTREEHWLRKGLDPNRPVIFFGSAGIWSANDHTVAELIHGWIERNELDQACQLFIRPHFSNVGDDVFKKLRGQKDAVIDKYNVVNTFSDNWDPTIEETIDFTNSILHGDIMINFGSTLTLDAACVDRPIINPTFGCFFRGGEDVTFHYQYGSDHYGWVLAENATALAFNPEELKKCINGYLLHPEKQRAERQNLINKLCYRVDGQASQRIFAVIDNILKA